MPYNPLICSPGTVYPVAFVQYQDSYYLGRHGTPDGQSLSPRAQVLDLSNDQINLPGVDSNYTWEDITAVSSDSQSLTFSAQKCQVGITNLFREMMSHLAKLVTNYTREDVDYRDYSFSLLDDLQNQTKKEE